MPDKGKQSILLVIERFYPLVGGAEVQCQQLAVRLIEESYDVQIVTKKWRKEFKRNEILNGKLTVKRLGINGFNRLADYIGGICLFWYLIKNASRYNLLFIDSGLANIFASTGILAGKIFKKKIIAKPETPGELYFSGGKALSDKKFVHPLIKMRLRIAKSADCYLAQTEEMRAEWVSLGIDNKKIISFPNSVDEELFSADVGAKNELKQKYQLPADKVLVFFCGRLVRRKGLITLFKAWKQITLTTDKAVLVIIGSGSNQPDSIENEISIIIKEEELEKSTIFLGNKEKEEVAELLKIADVFVYPSIHPEGRAVSVLEAMSCNVPVVVTEIGGLKEIVTNEINGILVKKEDIKELSSALLKLINDKQLRIEFGNNARKEIIRNYSLSKSIKEMEKIIISIEKC